MESTPVIKSHRMTVYEGPDFKVDLEYTENYCIIHLPVLTGRFNRDLYSLMLAKFDEIKEFASVIGYMSIYAAVYQNDKRTAKLANRFGMDYIGTADGFDIFEIFVAEEKEAA